MEGRQWRRNSKNEMAVRQILPLFVQACIPMQTTSLNFDFPSLSSFILGTFWLGSHSTLGMHEARAAGLILFPALSIFERRAKLFIHYPRFAPLVEKVKGPGWVHQASRSKCNQTYFDSCPSIVSCHCSRSKSKPASGELSTRQAVNAFKSDLMLL